MDSVDHKIRETSMARPRLRSDIRTHYQEYQNKPSYVVEDTASGKYYQIGFPEHQFIQCLDGRTTVAEAVARNAASQGENAIKEQQADQLVRWLVDHDLLETETSSQGDRRREQFVKRDRKKPKKWITKILFFRIPTGCPDALFNRITPAWSWLFSPVGIFLWLALLIFTGLKFIPEWDRFLKASGQIIAPTNWFRMILVYGALKILHEFGHGIATKKYKGEIPEWGAQLLLLVTPMAYVDATSSWRFPSRWHRIVVSAAGMYIEIALGALCLLGWLYTDPGPLNSSLHSAVIAATFITVIFNANPLMRFDGYYILVDLLGIPNLASKGQQYMKWFGKKFLLGMKDERFPHEVKAHPFLIPTYGILAAIWKVVIWIGIMITLSMLFKGAGFVVALCLAAGMLIGWIISFSKFVFAKGMGPSPLGAFLRIGLIVGLIFCIGYFVTINPTGRAVAVVEYLDKVVARAGCDGLVKEVYAKPGDQVREGDLLLKMHNPDLETELAQIEVDLRMAKLRAHQFHSVGELSSFQAEVENIDGLEQKLQENRAYLSKLNLRAPISGTVMARNLNSLDGQWLRLGAEILSIAPSSERQLLISIRQRDIDSITHRSSDTIRCRLRGRHEELEGVLEVIETRATRSVPHDVLISSNGGPLTIRSIDSRRDDDLAIGVESDQNYFRQLDEQQSQVELVKPRFAAKAKIEGDAEALLMEGEWGYVRLSDAKRERVGRWVFDEVKDYISKKIEQIKTSS